MGARDAGCGLRAAGIPVEAAVSMLDVDGRVITRPDQEPMRLVDLDARPDFDGTDGRLIERFRKSAACVPIDPAYGHDDHQLAVAMAQWYELGRKETGPEIDSLRRRLHAALLEADHEKKLRPMYRGIGFDQGALAMRETVAAVLEELGEDDYAAIVRELPLGEPDHGSTDHGATANG